MVSDGLRRRVPSPYQTMQHRPGSSPYPTEMPIPLQLAGPPTAYLQGSVLWLSCTPYPSSDEGADYQRAEAPGCELLQAAVRERAGAGPVPHSGFPAPNSCFTAPSTTASLRT